MPKNSDIQATQVYSGKPKVGVATCQDERDSKKAGSIGLTGISVKKEDLEDLVTSHILHCLNNDVGVNVEQVSAEKPEEVKKLATSLGLQGLCFTKVKRLKIESADSVLDPARVELQCEVWLFDAKGRSTYHDWLTGKHTERIGLKSVATATGRLVDAAARSCAQQLGEKLKGDVIAELLK
jgi:hypothetical protein